MGAKRAAIVVGSVMMLLIISVVLVKEMELGCDRRVVRTLQSPDGQWHASQIAEECGSAIGSLHDIIELERLGNSSTWSSGRIFEAAMSRRGVPLLLWWSGATHLEIAYGDDVEVVSRKDNFREVNIRYEVLGSGHGSISTRH